MGQTKPRNKLTTVTPMEMAEDASTLERILSAIPEGRATAISYARQLAIKDTRYRALVEEFDVNRKVDLGQLCQRHEIAPQDFLADVNREAYPILEEAMKFSHALAQRVVAARLPKVVERGMIEGGKADGVADRHFTLQKEGFHVAPKGMSINLTQNQLNQQAGGLPNLADEVKDMASILGTDAGPLELEAGDDDAIELEIENDIREKVEA